MRKALQIGKLSLHRIHRLKIGEQQEKTSLRDLSPYKIVNNGEICFAIGGFLIVQDLQDTAHLIVTSTGLNHNADLVLERQQASLVRFLDGDVGNDQSRVDGVIKQAHSIKGHLHHSPLVNQAVYLLRSFILILVNHQMPPARGCFPVYHPDIVSRHILANAFKLHVVADLSDLLDSSLRQPVRDGHQFIFPHLDVRGVHRNDLVGRKTEPACEEPDRGTDKGVHRAERIFSSLDWPQGVGYGFRRSCGHQAVEIQVAQLKLKRNFVDDTNTCCKDVGTFNNDAYLVIIPVREFFRRNPAARQSPSCSVKEQKVGDGNCYENEEKYFKDDRDGWDNEGTCKTRGQHPAKNKKTVVDI